MPEVDASESRKKVTLYIRNVEYPDGSKHDWVIPPFSRETECSYLEWLRAQDEQRVANIEAIGKGERPVIRTKTETYAELLSLAVKDPALDAEFLAESFSALELEDWGLAVQDFFLRRRLPDDELRSPPLTTSPA